MNRLENAKAELRKNPDVVAVGYGFKFTGGVKTNARCVVVGVKTKRPLALVSAEKMIPRSMNGIPTDVQEMRPAVLPVTQEFKQKMRPCPPGFSIGHTSITAGTLGAYMHKPNSSDYVILSNNHVLANSNQGKVNDKIIQPGKYDGGFSETDLFAWLTDFALIKFDGNDGGCNLFSKLMLKMKGIRAVEQPYPNLVDAAIATPVNQGYVRLDYPDIGTKLAGLKKLELGDNVQKCGRTTEHTTGTVDIVDAQVSVQYDGGVATFEDQLIIRASNQQEFSAGGDSGSAILDESGTMLGGLLFAGSSGSDPITIANRIEHVVNLLGIEV